MKTLVFSQCHIRHDVFGRLMRTSIELVQRLNPGIDILMIDNASPLGPEKWLPGWPVGDLDPEGTPRPVVTPRSIMRFGDAIGHLHYDREKDPPPRDGPGRGMMTALRIAHMSGYSRAVYVESDCLFAKPVSWGFERMTRMTACCPRLPGGYLDWQVWWIADLPALLSTGFVERYDWRRRHAGERPGELLYEELLGEGLEVLPVRGGRGSHYRMLAGDVMAWPGGIDYITHADRAAYCAFLERNGHGDLAPFLMSGKP